MFNYVNNLVCRISRWMAWALICGVAAGVLCNFSKEDGIIPVNKNLWYVDGSLKWIAWINNGFRIDVKLQKNMWAVLYFMIADPFVNCGLRRAVKWFDSHHGENFTIKQYCSVNWTNKKKQLFSVRQSHFLINRLFISGRYRTCCAMPVSHSLF